VDLRYHISNPHKTPKSQKITKAEVSVKEDHGIEGDAHAGTWHRQVSLLALESIERARSKGLDVTFGDFAENITTGQVLKWDPNGD